MSPAELAAFYEALQELSRVTERGAAWQRDGLESVAAAVDAQTDVIERQFRALHGPLSGCPICGVTPAKAIACTTR